MPGNSWTAPLLAALKGSDAIALQKIFNSLSKELKRLEQSISSLNLDDLGDVVISAPEEFQTLEYDGTNWVNKHASVVTYVRNVDTVTLPTGTCVYLYGATGDHATVKRADNDSDTTSSKTIGVVGADITVNNNGPVITRGYVDGIDLSVGYSPGDVLWLGEDGAFTKTKPTSPEHLVFIGVVVRATNNGIIYVATQNGYEFDELHNVSIVSPATDHYIYYDGTTALWKNKAFPTSLPPSGAAGGKLSGTYPNPGINAALGDLNNVSSTAPSTNQVLKWNGSTWAPATDSDTTYTAGAGLGLSGTQFRTTVDGLRMEKTNNVQSINNATFTAVAFAVGDEIYDTENWHTSTNNTRVTLDTAGKYLINGSIEFVANAAGIRSAALRINGSTGTYIASQSSASLGSILATTVNVTMTIDLAANDYIELIAYQTSGGALNVNNTRLTSLTVTWLGY